MAKTLPLETAVDILLKLEPLIQEIGKLKHELERLGIKTEVNINLTYGIMTIRFKHGQRE